MAIERHLFMRFLKRYRLYEGKVQIIFSTLDRMYDNIILFTLTLCLKTTEYKH